MAGLTLPQALAQAHDHWEHQRLPETELLCRQILHAVPGQPHALYLLGLVALRTGHAPAAVDLLQQAAVADPAMPAARNSLGEALRAAGHGSEAEHSFRQALELQPEFPEALNNLGNVLVEGGAFEDGVACFQRALAARPGYARPMINLGVVHLHQGHFGEAVRWLEQAIRADPAQAEAYNRLGQALTAADRPLEAVPLLQRALELRPHHTGTLNNLALAFFDSAQYPAALAHFAEAARLDPADAVARMNCGMAQLLLGDFAGGWENYEWRWQTPGYPQYSVPYPQPQWQGEWLPGATILIRAEQGFGDTLQFVRLLPWVERRGLKIILEGPSALRRLLEHFPGLAYWVTDGETPPPFTVQSPLLSLAMVLGLTRQNLPREVPYLSPPAERVAHWRARIGAGGPGLRVGLVWSSGPLSPNPHRRSLAPELLCPLLRTPGCRFFSLQKGDAGADAKNLPQLWDWSEELTDFAETAAFVQNLDLVITIDSAVAHVAGALAKPVWVLLPFAADWRWGTDPTRCDWYPTMRLFRQSAAGKWPALVGRVAAELQAEAASFALAALERTE